MLLNQLKTYKNTLYFHCRLMLPFWLSLHQRVNSKQVLNPVGKQENTLF